MNRLSTFYFLLLTIALVMLPACTSVQQMTLVKDTPASIALPDYPDFVIAVGDELTITVSALNTVAAEPFNTGRNYLVKADGTIDLPLLGNLQVEGKTLDELKAMIQTLVADKLQNAYVYALFASASVSVMGEVRQPKLLYITRPLTVFDALGAAGGLTRNASYTQVEVLRTEGRHIVKYVLDLTSPSVFNSPAYYIIKSDVVNVKPLHAVLSK